MNSFFNQTLLFAGLLVLLAQCKKEPVGLNITYPTQEGLQWDYRVYKLQDGDTTKIGTARTVNQALSKFQNRNKVLEVIRSTRLDSLIDSSHPTDTDIRSSYFEVKNGVIYLFADSYFDVFDGLLNGTVLDTLCRNGNGDKFQRFSYIEPKWIRFLNLDNNPDILSESHPKYRVFIDFFYREQHITGQVFLSAQTVFDDFDLINTLDGLSLLTYRFKTITYLDFELKKDGLELPPFRNTLLFKQWIHQKNGIIQRERASFELFIPQIPSRYGIMSIPGELWRLEHFSGFDS